MRRIHKLRFILYRSILSHFGHFLLMTNIDIAAPLGNHQFFWGCLLFWGNTINPSVSTIFTAEQIDCIISKLHHAFFVSFKYFHAVGTGESHGNEASISEDQPVDGWLYSEEQRVCQNDESHTFSEITYTYPNDENAKPRIMCKTIP